MLGGSLQVVWSRSYVAIRLHYIMEDFHNFGIVSLDKLSVVDEDPVFLERNKLSCLQCPSRTDGEEDNSISSTRIAWIFAIGGLDHHDDVPGTSYR